ncbi:MAG: 4-coumarate--CoA ligase family protein [Sporichthyaceae bacterium]|nr:4-coumarate--CoA ligase family protein [Sporichthyaceae bacterium]
MSFHSPHGDIRVPDLALHQAVLGSASARGEHPALVDGLTGQIISYARLAEMVEQLAGGFAAAGIRKGDVIGLFSPNSVLYPVVFHAALTAGATVTTINALATAHDLQTQLADSKAKLLVTISAFLDRTTDLASVEEVLVCDTAEGHRSIHDLLESGADAPQVEFDPAADLAVLPYSSGTTGTPKGVMLTHRNLVANVAQAGHALPLSAEDRVIAVLPFFHIYGLTVLMNVALASGATVVPLPRFDLSIFLRTLQDHRITKAFVAPPIVLAMAKHPMVDDYDLSSLSFMLSGAAPLDGELAEACSRRLNCTVVQGYGMTELSPVSHVVPEGESKPAPGSVGKALAGTECRLIDVETGADLGVGETGELLVRGPQVMTGYLGHPEATDATVDAEGWLHTGDLARVDEDSNWYIVDRVKELIKYKGYQVPPAELEAVLLTHPGIADAAVIGTTDAEGEEYPHAFVVVSPGSDVSAEDVTGYVAERVAPYKKIRGVQFVESIPKSASGKILRKDLRGQVERSG